MGPEGAVDIIFTKQIAAADDAGFAHLAGGEHIAELARFEGLKQSFVCMSGDIGRGILPERATGHIEGSVKNGHRLAFLKWCAVQSPSPYSYNK